MNEERIDVSIDVGAGVMATVEHSGLRHAAVAGLQVVYEAEQQQPRALDGTRVEISILVTDDDEIQRLNREYRGIDRPTDILSFSLVTDDDGKVEVMPMGEVQSLGDIVISHAYASRQAAELGHSAEMELAWLVIHGTLQLVGYSHDTDEAAQTMEALEHAALQRLGFTVP
jgi:probable rRNA maturation factor